MLEVGTKVLTIDSKVGIITKVTKEFSHDENQTFISYQIDSNEWYDGQEVMAATF